MGDMTVDELKSKKLWFLWSAKPGKNGKVTKVPFAANGGATGTDDAHKGTWVSFNAAESARNQFQASGILIRRCFQERDMNARIYCREGQDCLWWYLRSRIRIFQYGKCSMDFRVWCSLLMKMQWISAETDLQD